MIDCPQTGQRRGAVVILLLMLLVVLIGMVIFAFEVSRMYLVRSQAQVAVDAGALAATLKLKEDNTAIADAENAASQFVQLNRVGWMVTVPENLIDIETGTWDSDSRTFSPTTDTPNAVRVLARQDQEPFMFAKLFGHSQFGMSRGAIAAGVDVPLDIMLVLDLSGSMSSDGRIQALRNAAPTFVDVIEQNRSVDGDGIHDQIGVMGYGVRPNQFDPQVHGNGTPYTSAPASLYPDDDGSEWVGVLESDLTDNYNHLRANILNAGSLQAEKYGGGTPIGAALRDGTHALTSSGYARPDVKKVVVLMSDGHANRPDDNPDQYALSMAAEAFSQNIPVYTISLGNAADLNLMANIATSTGGLHYEATGSGESELTQQLTDAFYRAALAIKRTSLVQ